MSLSALLSTSAERADLLSEPGRRGYRSFHQNGTSRMTFVAHGKNLVAGDRIESEDSFFSAPVRGVAQRFCAGCPDLVDRACQARIDELLPWRYAAAAV